MTLSEFLVKAKINTYAIGGEGGETRLDDGSKEFIYKESDFKYRDRYFGSRFFAGEEVVWQNGKVIWAMNYCGGIFSGFEDSKKVYNVLKEALKRVKQDRPFRGPKDFTENDFEYIDESKGDVGEFIGVEKIFYKGKEIYKLNYHGGFVKIK